MKIDDILERFKPLFEHEIMKFSSMGVEKEDIKGEIYSLILKVRDMNLNEIETGRYLKTAIENNLRRMMEKNKKIVFNDRFIGFSKRSNKIKNLLREIDAYKLNKLERFVYILRRSGLKRMEIAKILNKSDSYVKVILRNIKRKLEVN